MFRGGERNAHMKAFRRMITASITDAGARALRHPSPKSVGSLSGAWYGDGMEASFWPEFLMWSIGALSVGTLVLVVGAWFSMGRSAYRKD